MAKLPHITHGFFTRKGGVSSGYYATLNTLEKKTDKPEDVIENRRRIIEIMGCEKLHMNYQTHSTAVHHVQESSPRLDGDALITRTPCLLIGVQTADCMPILIAHKKEKIVAAIHAGWKGSIHGVIQSTLEELKKICNLGELVCAVGPCIGKKHLEVGEEVYDMAVRLGVSTSNIFQKGQNNKWHLNLRALAQQILKDSGIAQIDQIEQNTYDQPETFFSYRRSTHKKEPFCGGQSSVIGIL